jgi:hypothetical protein
MKSLDVMTDAELSATMEASARAAQSQLPKGTGFCILAWDGAGIAQYISTGRREDMIKFLRETADRLGSRADEPRA